MRASRSSRELHALPEPRLLTGGSCLKPAQEAGRLVRAGCAAIRGTHPYDQTPWGFDCTHPRPIHTPTAASPTVFREGSRVFCLLELVSGVSIGYFLPYRCDTRKSSTNRSRARRKSQPRGRTLFLLSGIPCQARVIGPITHRGHVDKGWPLPAGIALKCGDDAKLGNVGDFAQPLLAAVAQ